MVYLIENEPGARIKVIGAGGCGGNAINHMIASGLQNVEFVAVNTDAQALRNNTASIQLQIGQTLTRGRERTALSFYEVQLLRYLHERGGQVVGRDELLDKVWGTPGSSNNRTVDNFVVKLRKKVEPHPDKPVHILTVYGLGYKLVV